MTMATKTKQKKQALQQRKPKTPSPMRIWKRMLHYYRNILYVVIVLILWTYLIYNWEKCISMQIFSQFDGNNILFLVGLALVILPFYKFKFEGKGVKIQAEMRKEMQDDFQNADSDYKIRLMQEILSVGRENGKEGS